MKRFLYLFLSLFPLSATAQLEDVADLQLAGNLYSYPYTDSLPPALTPAPDGYVPFHMEHYGRHGSRYLIGHEDYAVPVRNLTKAKDAGKLTPLGEETLEELLLQEFFYQERLGDLTSKGAYQQNGIGTRMARNFPSIFSPGAKVSAYSTPVVRCILSMANAIDGIKNVSPGIKSSMDASYADMWFMNNDDKEAWLIKDSVSASVLKPYRDSLMNQTGFLSRLVSDQDFARDSVAPGLMPRLYWVLGDIQNLYSFADEKLLSRVFSREELENYWKAGNAGWFIHGGNSALTHGRMPLVQKPLLKHIIDETDRAIKGDQPGANLRFGHDGILIGIITLMELGGYGEEINSFEELENSNWNDFDIIPMAGNLQLIFYRPSGKGNLQTEDILVKALINEKEVSMPGSPVSGPYYRWSDLRDYYLKK